MLKITELSENDLFTNLEVVHYEYESYLNILEDLKKKGYNDEYWTTWKDYIRVLGEYETLKEQLRVTFVIPLVGDGFDGNWEANFETGEIYIVGNEQIN